MTYRGSLQPAENAGAVGLMAAIVFGFIAPLPVQAPTAIASSIPFWTNIQNAGAGFGVGFFSYFIFAAILVRYNRWRAV